jgi:hypothetical protein
MMASRHRLRLKSNKRRERARARDRALLQPVAAQSTQSGVQVLQSIDQHFENIFGPKSLRDVLSSLASKY